MIIVEMFSSTVQIVGFPLSTLQEYWSGLQYKQLYGLDGIHHKHASLKLKLHAWTSLFSTQVIVSNDSKCTRMHTRRHTWDRFQTTTRLFATPPSGGKVSDSSCSNNTNVCVVSVVVPLAPGCLSVWTLSVKRSQRQRLRRSMIEVDALRCQ